MSVSKLDSKKRIVLSEGLPGDVFDIQKQGDGRFLLVRLEKPKTAGEMNREECKAAIRNSPIRLTKSWEELRKITREL